MELGLLSLGNRWHHPSQATHAAGTWTMLRSTLNIYGLGLPVSFQLSPRKQKCGLFSGCWWLLRNVPFSCVTADLLDALASLQRYWAIQRTNLVQMLRTFSPAGWADSLGVSSGWKSLQMIPISLQILSLTSFGPQEIHCKYVADATPENACLLPWMIEGVYDSGLYAGITF